jgi:DNA (cytosine-5)-methyltransferase 1
MAYKQQALRELALFAGAGGGILGGKLLGWETVCAVEWEPYPAAVLAARQNEGFLPPFPIWDDVQTFDGRPWRGLVDVVSGGFPCQDISAAGKGAGITGERSGMWSHMARIIGEVRPRFVFVENSPMLTSRGLGVVLGDLAALGYDAEWGEFKAADVGADHARGRLFILCADTEQCQTTDPERHKQSRQESCFGKDRRMGRFFQQVPWNRDWEAALSEIRGMADGLARSVDRTDAIRNGQVPAVVRVAWSVLHERLMNR